MEPRNFIHKHPLHFFEEWSNVHGKARGVVNCSSGCGQPISTQFYACIDCKFFLHKSCSELPLNITHPFHDKHPLILLSDSPYESGGALCDFCGSTVGGFVYHCSSCKFDLDIKCALLPEFLNGDFPKVDHHIHVEHPLLFIKNLSNEVKLASSRYCSVCLEQLSNAFFYTCVVCKLFLHESCSETELPLNINHPFHEKHTLTLTLLKSNSFCQFCYNNRYLRGLFYHCSSCRFNLHIKCALLPEFLNGDFPKFDCHIHVEHPLFFIKNLSHEVKLASSCYCSVCLEQLSSDSSFYTCLVCKLFLHKSCFETELPLNINHPFHEKHTLTVNFLKWDSGELCQFCHNDHYCEGLFYHCSSCRFKLHIKCALLPEFLNEDFPKVDHHIHVEHPLFFIKILSHEVKLASSRYCSVCLEQLSSDASFYTCLLCKLFLHKSCLETELPLNINHPFHEKHTLTLTLLKSNSFCQFCYNNRDLRGLFYHCSSCRFNLHIKCALLPEFLNGDFPKVDHHIHVEHPLFFIKNLSHEVKLASSRYCSVCLEQLSNASFYTCVVCKLFLHKSCSETELPLSINHPFHEKHTLTLTLTLLKGDKALFCQFCHSQPFASNGSSYSARLFYHCSSCYFNLDIKCAFLPQFLTGNFPKLDHHFSDVDEHPLFFIQKDLLNNSNKVKLDSNCFVCAESVSGSSLYYCPECQFFLHKSCVFEELPLKINHSFHDEHAITLTKNGNNKIACNFCLNVINGFMYKCRSCTFYLDTQCALLITKDLPKRDHHFSHAEHPLTFVQMLNNEVKINSSCSVCSNPLLGTSFYNCPDCGFFLHKECEAELWPKIDHVAHPQHPLIPVFSEYDTCNFCQGKSNVKKSGYKCPPCVFYIHHECTLPRFFPESKIHEHQLSPFMGKNPFICNACGGAGDDARYFCSKCSIMIHKDCIFLPKLIKFKLHNRHKLRHNYRFPEKVDEKWTCQFCFKKVEAEYGSYKCLHSNCPYILHGSCVKKNKDRLYIEVESENEESDDEASSSSGAVELGDRIKHFSHKHDLVLDNKEIIMNGDKKCCDGCALPISTAAYNCRYLWCNFSLDNACAQIGEHKSHWAFRDPLQVSMVCHFRCQFCNYDSSGFCCFEKSGCGICVRCSAIDFITKHEAHAQHFLFCDEDHKGPCSGCGKEMGNYGGYKCTLAEEEEKCKFFALDYRCLTRPLEVQHRFHHHPLKLTYEDPYKDDDGDPFQHMCEICEDRRDPKLWFYRCDECDFDAHPDCVLGEYPFIKRGSISNVRCDYHDQRPLIYFQSEKYPYPKCEICGHPCKDQLAPKCPHSECNFTLHFKCRDFHRQNVFSWGSRWA